MTPTITRVSPRSDFVPSGFFALRTPLLPFDEVLRWGEGLEAPDAPDDVDALARDRARLRSRIRELVDRPEVREAIFLASPSVEALIDEWIAQPDVARGPQCERALVRYVGRMAGRSTPFGLFAGVSTGTVGDDTNLVLDGRSRYCRTTRLDAGYLVDVVEGLLTRPEFREDRTYTPNPSLYRCGDRRRYVHSRPAADEDRHRLISVRDSEALASVMRAAVGGARPAELRAALVAEGHPEERAANYVDDLIAQQVVVPDVDVLLTGADATYGLASIAPRLADVRTELAALDTGELGQASDRYRDLAATLEDLPAEVKPERLFQVDLTKQSDDATLGHEVVREILRGVELLQRIGHRDSQATALDRFVERFRERYEGQSVPLLEALDPDLGVSFGDDAPAPSPLIDGIAAPERSSAPATWSSREDHLLARVLELEAAHGDELALTPLDLDKLERPDVAPLPEAFAALVTVAASSRTALAAGRFRVLIHSFDGPSGARLLGRFCHADPRLHAAVESHLRAEEAHDPEAVYAEIVHVARARDVNIVARPVLREYEIVCLGGSGVPPERRISLDDLFVSVREGRVVLDSRRLGRRVVPRLTSAHNFRSRGMSVYRFLCALQNQDVDTGVSFWGPLAAAPFLPRVRLGRILLATARWRVDAETLGEGDYGAVQAWRRARRVPRFVASVDFGGQLPVDLDNVLAVESLVQSVRSRGSADLVEFFPPPGELCVEAPEGAFAHELVVPFVRTAAASTRPSSRAPAADALVRRRFAPGSEWLYARLYLGETTADTVLTQTLAPLVRETLDAGVADRWFFVRYRDPEFHLRIRFHGEPATLSEHVLPAVEKVGEQLVDDGLVWRVELGTYQLEAERYGGPEAIELVESAFHADSDAVIAMLPLLEPGDTGLGERWQLGLAGAHRLLADVGLDARERLALVREQRDTLIRGLRWNATSRGRVGARFREQRLTVERLLAASPGDGHPLEPGLELLQERSARLAPIADELRQLERSSRLTLGRAGIAGSLLHMHLNRLLRGDNTAQELVICDFLARVYEAGPKR